MTEKKNPGSRSRTTFSPEYKQEAARLVIDTGRTVAEVSLELNLGAQTLGKWVSTQLAAADELKP